MKKEAHTEKLQKVLARAGYGSRRELERWIAAGRVRVNGERASIGIRVSAADVIQVDGKRLGRRALGRHRGGQDLHVFVAGRELVATGGQRLDDGDLVETGPLGRHQSGEQGLAHASAADDLQPRHPDRL